MKKILEPLVVIVCFVGVCALLPFSFLRPIRQTEEPEKKKEKKKKVEERRNARDRQKGCRRGIGACMCSSGNARDGTFEVCV